MGIVMADEAPGGRARISGALRSAFAVCRVLASTVLLLLVVPLTVATVQAQENAAAPARAASVRIRDDATDQSSARMEILAHVLGADPSAPLRENAAWGLSRFAGSPAATEALATALTHDASAGVREMSAWSLAHASSGRTIAASALTRALESDASPQVRATSAWALGSVGVTTASVALAAALRDSNEAVRERAIWALGRIGAHAAPSELLDCLHDPDTRVRSLAAWALRSISDAAAIPALKSAFLRETDPRVRVDDMRALVSMGDASLDAIRTILESPDKNVQAAGIDALAGGRASGPWPWPWPDPRPFP